MGRSPVSHPKARDAPASHTNQNTNHPRRKRSLAPSTASRETMGSRCRAPISASANTNEGSSHGNEGFSVVAWFALGRVLHSAIPVRR
jgi:hypothetical protein